MENKIDSTLKERLEELEELRAEDSEYLELIKEYYDTAKMNKIDIDGGYELIIHWYNPDSNTLDSWRHIEITENKEDSTGWIKIPTVYTPAVTNMRYSYDYPIISTTSSSTTIPYYSASTSTYITSNTSTIYDDKISTLESKVDYLMGAINGKTM